MQYRDNPSWLTIASLGGTTLTSPPAPLRSSSLPSPPRTPARADHAIELSVEMIPVSYSAVLAAVPPLHGLGKGAGREPPFDLVIHLGVAGPGGVKLEGRGRRWGYDKVDVDGLLAPEDTGKRREGRRGCVGAEWDGLGEGAEEELRTLVRREIVSNWVAEQGVRIRESDEAGESSLALELSLRES